MKGIKRILAPVDLSACSQRALSLAVEFSFSEGAQLHVLFVELLHGERYDDSVRSRLELMVRDQLARKRLVGLDVEYSMERDFAAGPAILRYAESHDMDLIVMGTHGRRGIRAWVLGSVASEVVRRAKCSVITVRQDGEDETVTLKRLLVPFDFSSYARNALNVALDVARSSGARIELIHIIEDRFHPAFYGPFTQSVYDLEPDIEVKCEKKLREEVASLDGEDLVDSIKVFGGYPGTDIAREARDIDADLILMATHGLTGLEHLLLGSVTEKTLSLAECPVLTVRPPRLKNYEQNDLSAAQVS